MAGQYYIRSHKTTVVAFEVGARGGLTDNNVIRLTNMHKKHIHKHIKKKKFLQSTKKILSHWQLYYHTTSTVQENIRNGRTLHTSTDLSNIADIRYSSQLGLNTRIAISEN